jgi:hypothetical protein
MALTARSQLRAMEVEAPTHTYQPASAEPIRESSATACKTTGWIVKYRWWIFGVMLAFYVAAFTGDWRIGRDSALYRGLGHTLATGRGFSFSEFGKRQIYPGLPVLLAGMEKVFGPTPLPPILVMHGMALGCLVLTYKLISLRYAQWVAICVTALVGFNGWFLELTNEILTDIPFLFSMMLALYGWERLKMWGIGEVPAGEGLARIERAQKHPWVSLALLLVGLGLGAVIRPTFLILAMAWGIVCVWGLLVGPGRKFYAICFGVLVAVWVTALIVDPRVKGFNPLGGGYERDAIHAIERVNASLGSHLSEMLSSEFSYGFFGQKWGPVLTELLCLIAILSSLLLLRVNPLWTLLVFLTVCTTLVMTPVPRYYVMVAPLLALGWILLAVEIARRVREDRADWVLALALALVFVPSMTRVIKVIGEQRQLNRQAHEDGPKWRNVLEMGALVRQTVPPGVKVIGPAASIMSYVSERNVVMNRDIFPDNLPITKYPQALAKSGVQYAVFPPTVYRKGDRVIRDMMERGVIVPVQRAGRTKQMVLAEVEIKVPPGDWRDQPVTDVMLARGIRTAATTTQPARVIKRTPSTSHGRHLARLERAKVAEKHQKQLAALKKKKKALKAAAATQKAAQTPTTAPAR